MADVTAASKAVATLPALWACCKTIFEAFCDNLVHKTWSKRAAKGKAGAPPNIWNGCTKQNTWKQITQYLLHCGTVLFAILALLLFVLALQVHATDQTQCNASEIKQRRYWSSCLFSPSYYHGCFYAFTTMGKKTHTHEYAFHTIFVPRTDMCSIQPMSRSANTDTLTFSWRTESKFAFNLHTSLLTDDILMDFLALEFWRIFCWWALTFELCPFAFHAATMLHPWKMLWATSYFAK